MNGAVLQATHPILGARDLQRAIQFYVDSLGFELKFQDNPEDPNYVGFTRDEIELHMQFQYEHDMSVTRLRILVDDPDALFAEYQEKGILEPERTVSDKPWGTREFALWDSEGNSLTFYRNL